MFSKARKERAWLDKKALKSSKFSLFSIFSSLCKHNETQQSSSIQSGVTYLSSVRFSGHQSEEQSASQIHDHLISCVSRVDACVASHSFHLESVSLL